MSKKALNIHGIFCMSIWAIVTAGCIISFLIKKDTVENMLYAFIVLFILFVSLLFTPMCSEFDKESLTIHFLFGFYQKINWESVWKVERIFLEPRYYRIFGDTYGRKSFFTSTKFPCNRKTQRLLREYWNEKFEK